MTMFFGILIDLLLVGIFVGFVVLFWKYGFARAVYKIGKTWLSAACSLLIGPWLTQFLQNLFLRAWITNAVHSTVSGLVQNNANNYTIAELFAHLPEGFVKILGNYQLSPEALEREFGSLSYTSDELLLAISERLADPCISMVSSMIGHIVGFAVPLFFFMWLNGKIRRSRKPFFRYVDKISGVFVGICLGYCAVAVAAVFLQSVFQIILAFDAHNIVADIYEKSFLFEFMSQFDTLNAIRMIIQR
jgi:hypothetical protein